jgi:23S rRNA (uracil1939-C5)-methyltransferase
VPQLTIEGLSHDGRGLARREGKVAFVAGALDGEVVIADLVKRHRRFDEYRLLEVLEPSADRIDPPCPLVGRCGGCDLQHLAGSVQIAHKSHVLLDQIARQSGLTPESQLSPLSADAFAYRRRARLAVGVPRRGGEVRVGLRTAGVGDIVPIDCCPVLVPALAALPGRLQALLNGLEHPAVLGHIELSLSETEEGESLPVIYLRMVADPPAADYSAFRDFASGAQAYLAGRVGDGPLTYLHRPLPQDPGYQLPEFGLRLSYLPGGFVQGNGTVNRGMVGQVVQWVTAVAGSRVLDAFCGVGNFALPLARRGCEVHGFEISADSVVVARANGARNGLANATFEALDLTGDPAGLRALDFDVAVLDPPRTGARQLVTALAERRTRHIVYVSCAPATLARDAAVLADAGYVLEKIRLAEMFPQTSHIESISLFRHDRRAKVRRGGGRGVRNPPR